MNKFFFLIALCFLGCGKTSFTPDFSATKHHNLKPSSSPYHYHIENIFTLNTSSLTTNKKATNQLPTQTWSNKLSLDLSLLLDKYTQTNKQALPVITFNYTIDNLVLEESDQIPKWLWSWDESIGENAKVVFRTNGLTKSKPMGSMLGDPRDYFLKSDNKLSFSTEGVPSKNQNGDLVEKLKFLDHPAFIGQYFLRGIPLDEVLHRSIVHLPPKQLKNELSWKRNHRSHLKYDSKLTFTEDWSAKKIKLEGIDFWEIKMTLKQSIPKGSTSKNETNFQQWTIERHLTAIVSPKDGMCKEIDIEEKGSWIDLLSYQNKKSEMVHQPQKHKFKNLFRLKRS